MTGISNKGELTNSLIINGTYPTTNFIESLKGNDHLVLTQNKYITDIKDIYETDSLISLTIHKGFIYNLLISKTTHHNRLLDFISDVNYFGNNAIYGVADGKFISILNSNLILKKDWVEKVNKSTLSEKYKQILLNSSIDDNPILILMDFKDF